MDFYRTSDKVVEKIRQDLQNTNHHHHSNSNRPYEGNDNNNHNNKNDDEVNHNHNISSKRKRKLIIEQQDAHNAMAPIDGNYSQMVKLFSNKEHEVTNLPTPDEIRVPLELYTVVQEKMINFRTELDETKRECYLLQRQHSGDLDKMSVLTQERNILAQALASVKLRLDQVSKINADLHKERDHHQGTSEALDNQVRYAQQEAEDRGQRLAGVLKDNDDLVGRKQWLEQQVIGLEVDRENQEKAATTAQSRLKLALMTATKLTAEKRNLMIALETIRDQLLKETLLVQQLEESQAEHELVRRAESSPISGVAYLRNNTSLQEWIKALIEQGQKETEERLLLARNQEGDKSNNNIGSKNKKKKANFGEGAADDDDDDDDEEIQATDAEARESAEVAMLMAIEATKKMKKFYRAKLESMERTIMAHHEAKSVEAQRSALMTLAKSFVSTTASPKSKNIGEENSENSSDGDDDDRENGGGDTKLGSAMRALTQFSSGVPAHLAKMMAESMAKEAELKRKRLEMGEDEDGNAAEISIDDDTTPEMDASAKSPRRQRRNLFGDHDDDDDDDNDPESGKNKTAHEKAASLLLLQALQDQGSGNNRFSGKASSSQRQLEISQKLSSMSPEEASSFVAQLIQSMNPGGNNNNDSNNVDLLAFSNILRTKAHDPMSRSALTQDGSLNNNNNNKMTKKPSFGTIQNLLASQNYQFGKSALFRKYFRDTNAEEERAALEAATESIMTGVRTAETMIDYVDECTAQSLSLQDLKDRWEAIKHLVRARISETASEAKVFSREFYRLLSNRFQREIGNNNNNNNNTKLDLTTTATPTKGNNNNSTAPNSKKLFFFGGKGSTNVNNLAGNNSATPLLPAQTKYYKANIASVVDSNFNKNKNTKQQQQQQLEGQDGGTLSATSPTASPASTFHHHKKVPTRNVAISCNIQPRPETAHWCHNTLIQPRDLNEVDGALFALLPKIFFELHNVIHEVIREARHRAKVTLPIADPSSFIGDGERRTIADVHCALKFDLFALMALRDLLRYVGRSQKGSVTSQELRERLIWYKECVESQRLAQLDERFKIDPKLLNKLNIVDRQALVKYRSETTRRFKMPGTLQVPDSTVEIDGYNNLGEANHNNNNNFDFNAYLANQQQLQQKGSAYNVLFDDPLTSLRQPDFVKEMFNNNNTSSPTLSAFSPNNTNNNDHLLWEVQQQLQQQQNYNNRNNNNQQHRSSLTSFLPSKIQKVLSFISNQSHNSSNGNNTNTQTVISPNNNNNNRNDLQQQQQQRIPANVVIDPRMIVNANGNSNTARNYNNNNNINIDSNTSNFLPPLIEKKAQTARNISGNNITVSSIQPYGNNNNTLNLNQTTSNETLHLQSPLSKNDNNGNNPGISPSSPFHPTLFKRQSPQMRFNNNPNSVSTPSPPKVPQNNNTSLPGVSSPSRRLGGALGTAFVISGFANKQEQNDK